MQRSGVTEHSRHRLIISKDVLLTWQQSPGIVSGEFGNMVKLATCSNRLRGWSQWFLLSPRHVQLNKLYSRTNISRLLVEEQRCV